MKRCRDCGRPLRDPTSVAAGRGRVCRAKHDPPTRRPRALDLPQIPPVTGQLDLTETDTPCPTATRTTAQP